MYFPTESTILIGVIGGVGLIASLVTLIAVFKRNQAAKW